MPGQRMSSVVTKHLTRLLQRRQISITMGNHSWKLLTSEAEVWQGLGPQRGDGAYQIAHYCAVQGRYNTQYVQEPKKNRIAVKQRAQATCSLTALPLSLTSSLIEGVSQTF